MKPVSAALVFFLLIAGCSPQRESKFSDPEFIRIAEYQDHSLSDSLIRYLKSPQTKYRAAAALAFASIQDTSYATAIGTLLLEDKVADVRRSAAYTLGQTGGFASVNALIPAVNDNNASVRREVLESLGKTVKGDDVGSLRNYHPVDSLGEEGLMWGLYRLALRRRAGDRDVEIAAKYLDLKYSKQTRLAAAGFFARGLAGPTSELLRSAKSDPSPEVRMASALALKKLSVNRIIPEIDDLLKSEKDYRVRVSLVNAMAGSSEGNIPLLLRMLYDDNVNVVIAASETLAGVTKSFDNDIYAAAKTTKCWRAQANLYKALYKISLSPELLAEIKATYSSTKNNYQKAWLLDALSENAREIDFVVKEMLTSSVHVIRSSAAQSIVDMNHSSTFSASLRPAFVDAYRKGVESGDGPMIATICSALADTTLEYRKDFKDLGFLRDAKAKLKLPLDFEFVHAVDEAIASLEGKPMPKALKNEWNHTIDWAALRSVTTDSRIRVVTNKGEIVIKLFPEDSPGSVANFVSLVRQHYFDGKFFHRTVPNFVIQTGCKRGDGSGGEDYSIRSELGPRRYTTGSVGMASAGKNTEGTQWFITHSPTPHLDGRYSIFAEVESGMDVVHQIEVGDKIVSVTMSN